MPCQGESVTLSVGVHCFVMGQILCLKKDLLVITQNNIKRVFLSLNLFACPMKSVHSCLRGNHLFLNQRKPNHYLVRGFVGGRFLCVWGDGKMYASIGGKSTRIADSLSCAKILHYGLSVEKCFVVYQKKVFVGVGV